MKRILIFFLVFNLRATAQEIKSVGSGEFEKGAAAPNVQVLDVRRQEEYKTGHIKGAFLADWTKKEEFEERVQHLDKSKPVYVYCLVGGRSGAAAAWMTQHGFSNVINLEGGISAWKKEGKPVEALESTSKISGSDYKRLVNSGPVVLVDFGAEWCPPCKKMEPVVAALQKEYPDLKLVKIDAGIETELMKEHKVEGIPVFILYRKGKEVWRQEGVVEKTTFGQALRKQGV